MITGVRPRRNASADMRYSDWHRTRLPRDCYCTDLDWIEWRNGKGIVAFIETKLNKDRVTDFQRKVFLELEKRSGIPFFAVRYNEELTEFMVMRLSDNFTEVFDEAEYIEWLSNLGKPTAKRVSAGSGFYHAEMRS